MEATTQLSSSIVHFLILVVKMLVKGNKLVLMRSIIKSVHRNGQTVCFASDEWRTPSVDQAPKSHQTRQTTKAIRSPLATRRSAAKNEYGGSFFSDNGG